MATTSRKAASKTKVRRKVKKNVVTGEAHIKSTFNNTIIAISDPNGAVIAWASAGTVGFKGSRKSTPFAAQMAAEAAGRRAMDHGMKRVDVFVKGPAPVARPRSARWAPSAWRSARSPTSRPCPTTAAAHPSAAASDPNRLKRTEEQWPVIPAP